MPFRGNLRLLLETAREEVAHLRPRHVVARTVASALPQFTLNRLRTAILRAGGLTIGVRSHVLGPILISGTGDPAELFSIGSESLISGPLHVVLAARVSIGDHVYVGHEVELFTVDHAVGPADRRCGEGYASPIAIGNGVWIGSRVAILGGVTIGAGAVVAAGAVVNRDVPEDTLVAGVPAVVVRELDHGIPVASRRWPFPVASVRARLDAERREV